jgi:hypothetical protein
MIFYSDMIPRILLKVCENYSFEFNLKNCKKLEILSASMMDMFEIAELTLPSWMLD